MCESVIIQKRMEAKRQRNTISTFSQLFSNFQQTAWKAYVRVAASRSANVTCLSPPGPGGWTAAAVSLLSLTPSVEVFRAGLAGGGGVRLYPNISSICSAATRLANFLFDPTPVHTLSPIVTYISRISRNSCHKTVQSISEILQ